MSTVKTDNIATANGLKIIKAETLVQGSAKSWVNLNGSGTIAIRDSFNVASLTDNGLGNYLVNLSVAMPSANIAPVGGGENFHTATSIISASVYRIQKFNSAHSADDTAQTYAALFGSAP